MEFRPIKLGDKSWVEKLMSYSNFRGSEYCFSNNFNWRNVENVEIARIDDFVILKNGFRNGSFLFPAGSGDIKTVIEKLIDYTKENNIEFLMHSITKENMELLEELFKDKFMFTYQRDYCDYIYKSESLVNLKGKKLKSKRNHINAFKIENEIWSYEDITKENIEKAYKMNIEWNEINQQKHKEGLYEESLSVKSAFENFEALNLKGGLLKVGDKVVAYTMGRPLNSDTFIVHIEKAFADVRGAYPLINQQFVLHNCQNFVYVNREEDTGDEGLRKAKLSYRPDILLEKYNAKLR